MQNSSITTPMFFTIRKRIDPKQASFALCNYPTFSDCLNSWNNHKLTMYRLLHIPSTIWSNHVHSRHFSHYGFSIYPFSSAFHSMTVLQVASQILISVIACCLWYMHPSYEVHTQGTWTLSKILFHGWHLATLWKKFTKFKIKQVLFLRNFSVPRFQKKRKKYQIFMSCCYR